MKQTLTFYMFEQAFIDYDRQNQFSKKGLRALFDWLTEYEESTGEELELDVIALCCDFTEYGSAAEACADFASSGVVTGLDAEEAEEDCLAWLHEQTTAIIPFDGGIIIQNF